MFRTTVNRRSTAVLSAAGLAVTALLAMTVPAGAAAPASTPNATEHVVTAAPDDAQAKPTKLEDYELQYSHPSGGETFTYTTNTHYWSVVGIRPWSILDVDLQLRADKAGDVVLGRSSYGTGAIDFVAVDSNHRPLGKLWPRVNYYDGTGTYDIELAQGALTLGDVPQQFPMGNDVVAVRDTYLQAGVTYRITVTPTAALMGAAVYVMDSLPSDSSTWVKGRGQSMAQAGAPLGQPASVQFTAPRTDYYGVVMTSNGYSGDFRVSRTTL